MNNAIGGVELSSMARGFDVADTMLKTAPVQLLLARTICPGKYIVLVTGEVADVQASVDAGGNRGGVSLVDRFVIPNVHPEVMPAISGTALVGKLEALGVVEAFSVSALIEAADAAVKEFDSLVRKAWSGCAGSIAQAGLPSMRNGTPRHTIKYAIRWPWITYLRRPTG